jgi:hypothetical protein
MIVRSHLAWPLRWALIALSLGFSAAIAMWAFEFGRDIAGLDRPARAELERLRIEVAQLRSERDKAQSIANSAESLLKAGSVAQERLAQQLRQAEADNLDLKADLGFFQRLLPTSIAPGVSVRALQAEPVSPGKTRYQLLVMQNGNVASEFVGRYEIMLAGTLEGQPWSSAPFKGGKPLQLRQYARVEGVIDHPELAVVKTVQVRVIDQKGQVVAEQTVKA